MKSQCFQSQERMGMKKILVVFGTRPEAIKLAPVITELRKQSGLKTILCVTAQHREMLDQVLNCFQIKPDYDLNVMKRGQDLFDITSEVLLRIKKILIERKPDLVLVQGDTTTAFTAALAAFYLHIKIAHVEAGLRTGNSNVPFPEEMNRRFITSLAGIHFAPTEEAKNNLLADGVREDVIFVTGNTIIDALFNVLKKLDDNKELIADIKKRLPFVPLDDRKIILITGHRRESFGLGFQNICYALKEIALRNTEVVMIFPVHLNLNVRKSAGEILSGIKNIFLIEPVDYESFVFLMNKSYLILTDSGGIQEEAPSLGKPVLVMRDVTERKEAVRAGTAKLVGTDIRLIVNETQKLLDSKDEYGKVSRLHHPFGDGKASGKIAAILHERLRETSHEDSAS